MIMQANLANIDSVMIAGGWRKRDGKLLFHDLDRVKVELLRSGSRILAELGWRPEPLGAAAAGTPAEAHPVRRL